MQRLRDLREDLDLTQAKMASMNFMQTTVYRRYESGEREMPLNIAIQFANFFGVSLDYLAGLTNNPKRNF